MADDFDKSNMSAIIQNVEASSLRGWTNWTELQDYLVSERVYRYILLTFGGFVPFVVSVIGIPGNIVCCVIFQRLGLRDRMNLYLFSLALVDLLHVAYALVWSSSVLLTYFSWFGLDEEKYVTCLRVNLGVSYGLRTTSGLYFLVIAIERCFCVLFPLRASSLLRTRTMAALLLVFAFIPQLGFSLLPLKYKVEQVVTVVGLRWQLVPSTMWYQHRVIMDAILYMIMSVVVPIVTFLIIFLATVITIIKLRAAMSWREKATSTIDHSHVQQTGLTKMLVLTSCVYIVTMVPFVSLIIIHLIIPEFSTSGRYVNVYLAYYAVAGAGPFINSAVNVFIYYSRSSRVRAELHLICNCSLSET